MESFNNHFQPENNPHKEYYTTYSQADYNMKTYYSPDTPEPRLDNNFKRILTYPPINHPYTTYNRTPSPLNNYKQHEIPAMNSDPGNYHHRFDNDSSLTFNNNLLSNLNLESNLFPPVSELKPFQCNECGVRFGRSHDLKRHHKIHLNLRPYVCIQCDRQFTRLDALRRHQATKKCRSRSQLENIDLASSVTQPID